MLPTDTSSMSDIYRYMAIDTDITWNTSATFIPGTLTPSFWGRRAGPERGQAARTEEEGCPACKQVGLMALSCLCRKDSTSSMHWISWKTKPSWRS